jgi:hypothetical protein
MRIPRFAKLSSKKCPSIKAIESIPRCLSNDLSGLVTGLSNASASLAARHTGDRACAAEARKVGMVKFARTPGCLVWGVQDLFLSRCFGSRYHATMA